MLVLVGCLVDQAAERVDLAAQLDLGRHDIGILKHLVGEAQLGRHAGEVLELERPAGARQVSELARFIASVILASAIRSKMLTKRDLAELVAPAAVGGER